MSRGVWIFAAVLNLLLGWELLLGWGAAEWVLASSWYVGIATPLFSTT
jgi:hypothetical protein